MELVQDMASNDGREPVLRVRGLSKAFNMHLRGGLHLPVIADAAFDLFAGECAVLTGPSGTGKSTILKLVYGNYRADTGEIRVRGSDGWIDVACAPPRHILRLRATSLGYVSQFLRVIPRVSALDIVSGAAAGSGCSGETARRIARDLLVRLNIPERLWGLPPATFSGGEQQRVNIATGFAAHHPVLLLDEPTASLDAANRDVVVELVRERKNSGAAILGIFHDAEVRDAVADRLIDVARFCPVPQPVDQPQNREEIQAEI